ncbi:GATOR complex protein WDR24-like [Schistocerca gregaria]|uniref:GATOR complex protein WDR24-like n=1 Tax=Schistocerca gregaria TaxID=7010 RepID=UPI00211F224B|nr:GATOR complex protein WDR24-like [Schistocerca gregaria]
MRLWDVRTPGVNNVAFNAKSEVRDVQYNPFANYQFAAALENGNIQIWDVRKSLAAQWTFPVHQGLVMTISWHPQDQYLLASGGRDRLIKVWDLQSSKDTKLVKVIQTIASVGKIAWRSEVQKEDLHIASSASLTDISIHVWDLKSPFVPLVTLKGAKDVITSHMWSDRNTVISCSKDGCMRRYDLKKHGYFPRRHMPTTALSWNVRNELAVVSKAIDRSPRLELPSASKASADSVMKVRLFEPSESIEEANGSFNHRAFEHLARNLEFRGRPIEELCSHNCRVAEEAKCGQLARVWKVIQIVYEREKEEVHETPQSEATAPVASWPSNFLSGGDRAIGVFLEEKGAGGPSVEPVRRDGKAREESARAPFEKASRLKKASSRGADSARLMEVSRNAPVECGGCAEDREGREGGARHQELLLKSDPSGDVCQRKTAKVSQPDDVDWDPDSVLPDILDHHELIGDVQTCVIVALMLHRELAIQPRRLLAWVRAYIDLLHRDRMWNSSNYIIKHCCLESVRDINKMNTSYATKCAACNKAMSDALGAYCSYCKKIASFCAVCNQSVKGIFVWCQVCGHGGHSKHMKQWFSTQTNCPMGCGHACQPMRSVPEK